MLNEQLSARQTAANNATPLAQQILDAYEKVDAETAKQVWKELADFIHEWLLQDMKKELENPYIVVYINKGKYDPDDEKYKDFFEKNGFKKSPQGGWHKRIRQQEYNKWLNEEKDGKKINDWILRAFEVKTQIADVQESEK